MQVTANRQMIGLWSMVKHDHSFKNVSFTFKQFYLGFCGAGYTMATNQVKGSSVCVKMKNIVVI